MEQLIIHPQENESISLIMPSIDCGLTIAEIARKDVPNGVPYKIVNRTDLPEDFEFFNAWEADFSNPDGIGIGHDAWFAEQEVKKLEVENDNNQPE